MKRCKHLGCRRAGMRSYQCFGGKVQRSAAYVVWATPAHREKPWAVGREVRPGCLKVAAYAESKRLADLLAEKLSDGRLGQCVFVFAGLRHLLTRRLQLFASAPQG
jgi:hypothetical protein